MNITVAPYGTLPSGEEVSLYTLTNDSGFSVSISNFGGSIINLMVPDKNGKLDDVVLAHAGLEEYLVNKGSFGAVIGRNSNRIAGAAISIDGITYDLVKNHNGNNLHTGPKGLQFHLFDAEAYATSNSATLRLVCTVFDLEDDLPGNLEVSVDYTITENNSLVIEYHAVSDKATIINMTNHSYFNLNGHSSGSVAEQILELDSSFFTPSNTECYPTGEIKALKGTDMDFYSPTAFKVALESSEEQIKQFGGIDHNYILNGTGYRKVATVTDPKSGRFMETYTDLPAIQVYTGNNLPNIGISEKDGANYTKASGFCLETQTIPNAAQMPWLATPIYDAGEDYFATTTYRFGIIK